MKGGWPGGESESPHPREYPASCLGLKGGATRALTPADAGSTGVEALAHAWRNLEPVNGWALTRLFKAVPR